MASVPSRSTGLVAQLLFFVCISPVCNSEYVGNIRGDFSVDQGHAVYKIPIDLPKGQNNIEPNLNMVYNSGAGNGPLGRGWNIDIVSVISRCPQTWAQDGRARGIHYDAEDRFCLDGQRLVAVKGAYGDDMSEYKTEVDTYRKVVSLGQHGSGPSSFKVWTKDGRIWDYGSSSVGKVIGQSQSSVHQWNLENITDRSGNRVSFAYIENSTMISILTYGTTSVMFDYDVRPDNTSVYFHGTVLFNITQRIVGIRINNTKLIRRYMVEYKEKGSGGSDQSLLASVKLCDDQNSCLKALTFNYDSTERLTESIPLPKISTSEYAQGWSTVDNPRILKDVNGDGLVDVVGFDGHCVRVALNDGNSNFAPGKCWVNAFGVHAGWKGANHPRMLADVDGDGLPDIVGFNNDGVEVAFNAGTFFKSPHKLLNSFGHTAGWRTESHPRFVEDINGDGRADIVGFFNNGVEVALSKGSDFETIQTWTTEFSHSSGWRIENNPRFFEDVNGDGLPDIVGFASEGIFVSINTGTSFSKSSNWLTNFHHNGGWRTQNHPRFVEDVNGDGLGDVVGFAAGGVYVSLSTGTSFTPATLVLAQFGETAGGYKVANNPRFVADMTGDGLPDIVGFANDGVDVSYNTGGGAFAQPVRWVAAFGLGAAVGAWTVANHPRYVTDTNGDGMCDIIGFANTGVHVSLNPNGKPNILEFVDSFDVIQSVSFMSLPAALQSGHYKRASSISYPMQSPVPPMSLVIRFERNKNTEFSNTTSYYYGGLKVDVSGRGSQGFQWKKEIDSQGRSFFTELKQGFPYTGKTKRVKFSVKSDDKGNDILVSEKVMMYSSGQSEVNDVLLTTELITSYELDGTLITEIENKYSGTNGYGDALRITSETYGGGQSFIKTTVSTYQDDPDKWLIGLPTSVKVKHTSPCLSSATRQTVYKYYADTGYLRSFTIEPDHALALTTDLKYDKYGNIVSKIEYPTRQKGHSRTVHTQYDDKGIHKKTSANSMGHTESYAFDAHDNLVNMTGVNGLKTTWTYDSLGRKLGEHRASGVNIKWSYNWDDTVSGAKYNIKMESKGSPPKTKVYDSLDRVIREETVGFELDDVYTDYKYNRDGLIYKQSYAYYASDNPAWSVYNYDVLGRVISSKTPGANDLSAEKRFVYNGLKTTQLDARGHSTYLKKDGLGRLILVADDLGGTVQYSYDPVGNLVQTIDTEGYKTKTQYDTLGHKVTVDEPNMGHWEYRHNAFGELTWQKDAKGNILTQDYDSLGRMTKRTEAEGPTIWAYDKQPKGLGKLSSVQHVDGYRRQWHYDKFGRESKTITYVSNTKYEMNATYDIYGRISQEQYPNGEVLMRSYTSQGFLSEIGLKQVLATKLLWKAMAYDASGRLKKEQYGNGLINDYEYDSAAHLVEITTHKNGDNMLRHLRYSYDLNENLISRRDLTQGMTEKFAYDNLDRLVQSTVYSDDRQYQRRQNWDYDNSGNIQFNDAYGLGPFVYHATKPQAVIKAGNHSYTYDANGNAIQKDGKSIIWTSYNKPSHFETTKGNITFKYGPDRQRYLKRSQNGDTTLYIGHMYEVETKQKVSTSKLFVYGAMGRLAAIISKNMTLHSQKVVSYIHTDNLGSVDTVTDESGNVLERFNYDAFGMRRTGNWIVSDRRPNTIVRGYTGHEHLDDLGLVHMNGRVYDPEIGRFLSPDPHVQDSLNTQSLNRYSYAMNNPLKHNDPTGYKFRPLKKLKKMWRPLLAAGVSYLTFGAATAIIGTAGLFGGSAVATGALAGAAAGFAGGTVASGNIKGGLQGALGGAVLGGIGGHFGDIWNLDRIKIQAIAGGYVSQLGGGKFKDGFETAGMAATARYMYNNIVHYDVDPGPGGPAEEKTANQRPYYGPNHIGTQGKPPDPRWFDDDQFLGVNWGEGGGFSRTLNRVPGINAVAGMHDVFQVKLDSVFFPGARDILNVPGMIPAAAITYVAMRDGPGMPSLLVDETNKRKR